MQIWPRRNEEQSTKTNSKIKPFVHESVLKPNCKGFSKSATLGKFNNKPDRQGKKHSPIIRIPTIFTNTRKNKRSVSNLVRFSPKKTWASAHRLVCLSKYSISSLWSQARGTFKATTRPSASSCNKIFHTCHFKKTTIAVKSVEHQKLVLPQKYWKWSFCFSEVIIDLFHHCLHEKKARRRTT